MESWGSEGRCHGEERHACSHQILRSLLSVWFRLLNSSLNPNCYCQSSNPVNQWQDWPVLLGLSAPLHQRKPVLNQRRGDWAWRKKLMAASPSRKCQCFNLHHLARKCPCWGWFFFPMSFPPPFTAAVCFFSFLCMILWSSPLLYRGPALWCLLPLLTKRVQ